MDHQATRRKQINLPIRNNQPLPNRGRVVVAHPQSPFTTTPPRQPGFFPSHPPKDRPAPPPHPSSLRPTATEAAMNPDHPSVATTTNTLPSPPAKSPALGRSARGAEPTPWHQGGGRNPPSLLPSLSPSLPYLLGIHRRRRTANDWRPTAAAPPPNGTREEEEAEEEEEEEAAAARTRLRPAEALALWPPLSGGRGWGGAPGPPVIVHQTSKKPTRESAVSSHPLSDLTLTSSG